MNEDVRMKQDNILWRLFRIFVEETVVPQETSQNVKDKVGVETDEA